MFVVVVNKDMGEHETYAHFRSAQEMLRLHNALQKKQTHAIIPHKDLSYDKGEDYLNEGSFGYVYRATWNNSE